MKKFRGALTILFCGMLVMIAAVSSCAPQPTAAPPTPTPKEEVTPTAAPPPTPTEVPVAPPKPLVVALPTDAKSFDPCMYLVPEHIIADRAIFDGLLELDDNMEPQLNLAESYEMLDDLTWQFKLKQGIKFHNGEPFNAEAVKFSIEHILREESVNAHKLVPVDHAEVIDEYTVNIVTSAPDPVLLRRMAFPSNYMVPPKYIEEHGAEYFGLHPVGTGPFKFVEWVKDDRITLEINKEYHRELPQYDTLIFRIIPENAAAVAALEAGEVDIVIGLSPSLAKTLEGKPNVQLKSVAALRTYYIGLDNKDEEAPTYDRLVRLALNYAVDIESIIEHIYLGYAQRAGVGPFGPGSFGYDPNIPPFPHDPEKAKELLAQAGYPDGFKAEGGYPSDYYLLGKELMQAIQGQLAEVGVELELVTGEPVSYWDGYLTGALPPVFLESMGSYFADADLPLKSVAYCDSPWSRYCDPQTDQLIDEAGTTMDADRRLEIYGQLQQNFTEDPPMIILFQLESIYGVTSRVQGFVARADDLIEFRTITLTQ